MWDYDDVFRLKVLLGMPHFLKDVQTVELSMDESTSAHYEQHSKDWTESKGPCSCGSGKVSRQTLALIEDILNQLRDQPSISLVLDFAWERCSTTQISPAPQASTLLRELLQSVRSIASPLVKLYVSDRFEVDPEDFVSPATNRTILEGFKTFGCVLTPSKGEQLLQSLGIKGQRDVVSAVNKNARGLKHFELVSKLWTGPRNEMLVALSRELFSGPSFPVLQSVKLMGYRTRQKTLLDFFDRCLNTLEDIEIIGVDLCDSGDAWYDVFRAFQRFNTLRSISLSHMKVCSDNEERYVKFMVPGSNLDKRQVSTVAIKNVDPKTFLAINVEKGLSYSKEDEPESLSAPSSPIQ